MNAKKIRLNFQMLFQYTDNPDGELKPSICRATTAAKTMNAIVFPRTAWWISRLAASLRLGSINSRCLVWEPAEINPTYNLIQQGCYGLGKLDFIQGQGKAGSFVSVQGISKSLFKVGEKFCNFIIRLTQIILLDVFS